MRAARQHIRALVGLSMACLILTACGDGGSPGPTTTSTPTPSTAPSYRFPPVTLQPVEADRQKAAEANLTLADLPKKWTTDGYGGGFAPLSYDLDESMVHCMFGDNPSPLTAYATSAVYQSEDGNVLARSFVRAVQSQKQARADFDQFKGQRISACQVAMYSRAAELTQGAPEAIIWGDRYGVSPPASLPVEKVTSPDGGSDVLAFRMVISPIDSPLIHQTVLAYGAGRFETVLLIYSTTAIDPQIEANALVGMKIRTLKAAKAG